MAWTERLIWINRRIGKPVGDPPHIPRVSRSVVNGVESWHFTEAMPLDAQTDEERMAKVEDSEIEKCGDTIHMEWSAPLE
jgi:hypothetical protein